MTLTYVCPDCHAKYIIEVDHIDWGDPKDHLPTNRAVSILDELIDNHVCRKEVPS